MGVDADSAARLATTTANHGGRYRRADQTAEPGRLGRRAERYAPGDAVAGRGPLADQRAQLPAAKDRRGSVAVRPGHSRPRLGLMGHAVPVRRDVPMFGRTGPSGPGAGAGGPGRAARARAGGRSGPPGNTEKHDAACGTDRPRAGLGGPPPQGPARCPPGAAQTRRAVRALLPNGSWRDPAGGPAGLMSKVFELVFDKHNQTASMAPPKATKRRRSDDEPCGAV